MRYTPVTPTDRLVSTVRFAVALHAALMVAVAVFAVLTWLEARRAADEAALLSLRREVESRQDSLDLLDSSPRPAPTDVATRKRLDSEIRWCLGRIMELTRRRYGDSIPPGADPKFLRRAAGKATS